MNVYVHETYISDIESKERENPESVHVVNIDIQDNHEEAVIGAFMICDLCALVSALATWATIDHWLHQRQYVDVSFNSRTNFRFLCSD